MKLVIAGSRGLNVTVQEVALLVAVFERRFDVTVSEIVSGGCRGIDKMGEVYAEKKGLSLKIFEADWSEGKKAGPLRNKEMAEYGDGLLLIWNGDSRGSASMLREAKAKDRLVMEVRY
ncbi:MAG: SLOG family protein [Bacteroidota bacterium]